MRIWKSPGIWSLLCGLLLTAGCAQRESPDDLNGADAVPPFVQLTPDSPAVPWDPETVGEFTLVDQNGQPVTRESMLGKPWIANFIFSRCIMQCPQTCRRMMELNEELKGTDVRFFTLTVDPENDTPEVMKEYADIWKADGDRWKFVTGTPENVWDLIRKGLKVQAWEEVGSARKPGMEFAHNNHLVHVGADGKILGRYNSGVESELTTLKRVLKGQIETPLKYRPATLDSLAALEKLRESAPAAEPADPLDKLPQWARRLPEVNAFLNGVATLLLLAGFVGIKAGNTRLHKQLMLAAFGVSMAFLASYLLYHYSLNAYAGIRGKPYSGPASLKSTYFGILWTHVVLAAAVPFLTIVTIRNGLQARWESHRRWAKVTFPIWLYVSVTGVMIYWMLYRL
ncbi:DUF420 domain-containing protein [Planctomicrobium sp. SH664]|uniref:DUF420 domain-containing protein n=1 Tax=Planctomicrobium sp. SH664 TaxID=3448125 RepID=UPI003F5AEA94